MPHARESDEQDPWLRARKLAQPNDCLCKRHPLRLPRGECPGQAKRELDPVNVALALSSCNHGQNGHPGTSFGLCEKAWPSVLGKVHKYVRWLPTHDVVVVGVVARIENDPDDLALASVYEAVLDRQVVEKQHRSANGKLQARSQAAKLCLVRR